MSLQKKERESKRERERERERERVNHLGNLNFAPYHLKLETAA